MDELKPCPFCGGEGYVQAHHFYGLTNTYGVVCEDCSSQTNQFFKSEAEAIKAWNMRKEGEENGKM